MRARPQRLHQTLGEAPHLTPGRAPDSQRSRCENEVAVVSAVGLHLPQTRAFQLQPDHQLATQPGACRKASAPRHLAEVPASATVWKVRPQTLRWAGECGAAWGCGGKAGSFGGGECQSSRGPKHVVGAAPAGARGTDPAVDTHSITRPLPSAAGGLLIMRTATTPAVPSPLRVWVMIPGSQTEPLQAKVLAVSKAMPETSLSAHRKSMGITQHVIFSSFILL